MLELTQQQQQAIDAGTEPPLFIDPRTMKTYVLLGTDAYDQIKRLLADDEDIDMRQVSVLVDRAMREDDANDPTLEYYQQKYGNQP